MKPVAVPMSALVVAWVTMLSPAPTSAADKTAAGTASTPRSYVVFFGLDVFANDQGKPRPVVGGSEGEVLVLGKDGTVSIPRRNVALTSAVEPKVSRSGAVLEALHGFPVHSPGANPVADAQSQLIAMQNVDMDRQEAAEVALRQAQDTARQAVAAAANTPELSPDRGSMEAKAAAANDLAAAAASGVASVVANPQFENFLPGSGSGERSFDGFEVAFRISTPEPHANAHGVLRLFLRDPARPEKTLQALHPFRIRSLDSESRKIVVRKFGLPPGISVESYAVHVYVDGRELATNTSQNRVEVTEEEAHQFVILRHVQRQRSASLTAQVADEFRPQWPQAALAADWGGASVDLSITTEGKVDDVRLGASASPLPGDLEAVLRQVRFLPALVSGKPAASTGTFALSELFLSP